MLHRPTDVSSATTTMQLVTELAALGRLISMEKEDREYVVQELRSELRALSEQFASSKIDTEWGAVTATRGGIEQQLQDHAVHFNSIQEHLEQEQLARELGHKSLREFLEELGQSVADKLKSVEAMQLQQGGGNVFGGPDLQLREECAQMFRETMAAHEELTSQLREEMAAITSVQEEVHATHRSTFGRHKEAIEAIQAKVAEIQVNQRPPLDDTFAPQGGQITEALEAELQAQIMQVSMDQKAGQAAIRDLVLSHRGELDAGYAGISGAHRAQLEAMQQLRQSVAELASKTTPQAAPESRIANLEVLEARMREEVRQQTNAQLARLDGGQRGADAAQRAALEALETRMQVELGRMAGDHRAAMDAVDARCKQSVAVLAREQQTWIGSLGALRAPPPREEEGFNRQRIQELEQRLHAEFAQASSDHQEVSLSVLRDLLTEHKVSSGDEHRGAREELDARLSTQIARVAQEQLQAKTALNELDSAVKQEFMQISRDTIQFKAVLREQAAEVERRLVEALRPQDDLQSSPQDIARLEGRLEALSEETSVKFDVRLTEEIAKLEASHQASHSTLWDCVMSHKTMLDQHASTSEELTQEQMAREAERSSLAVVLEELDRRMESMRDSAQERKQSQSQVLEELDRRFEEEAARRRTEVQLAVAEHASVSERQVVDVHSQIQQDLSQRDERFAAFRTDLDAMEVRLREEIGHASLAETVQLSSVSPPQALQLLRAPQAPQPVQQLRTAVVYSAAPPSSNSSSVAGGWLASTEGPHVWPAGTTVTTSVTPGPLMQREVSSTQASQAGSVATPAPQVIHKPTIVLPFTGSVVAVRQSTSPGAMSRAISVPAEPMAMQQAVLSAVPTATSMPRRAGSSSPVPLAFAGFAGGQRSPRSASRPPARPTVAQQVRISTTPRSGSPPAALSSGSAGAAWQRDQSPWRTQAKSRSPSTRPMTPTGAPERAPPGSRPFAGPGLLGNGFERELLPPMSSSLVAPSFRSLNKCLSLLEPGPTAASVLFPGEYEDVPTRPASRTGRRSEGSNGDEP